MTDSVIIKLPNDLNIAHVAGLKTQLLEQAGEANQIVLQAEAVDRLDTAGLQLLVAMHNSCEARGASMQLLDVPHAVQELIQLSGCSHIL